MAKESWNILESGILAYSGKPMSDCNQWWYPYLSGTMILP